MHVAFTRAKDRLYVTSHRIAEGSADASSVDAATTSHTATVKRVQPTQSIPLPQDQVIMHRTIHPVDEVEVYLGRCADRNHEDYGEAYLLSAFSSGA